MMLPRLVFLCSLGHQLQHGAQDGKRDSRAIPVISSEYDEMRYGQDR